MNPVNWSAAEAPTHRPMSSPDLAAYLERIGCALSPAPLAKAALLDVIVRAHSFAIPFESLDVTLHVPISLAPSAVFSKLVTSRRGGYCLENSFLLLAALQALGFDVRLRAARVWMRAASYTPDDPPIPRAHAVLLVRAGGGDGGGMAGDEWLVDVGFGGGGPATPLPLRAGAVTAVAGDVFRTDEGVVAAGEDAWVLWGLHSGAWKRLYSFDHSTWDSPRVHAADFISTNCYVSTTRGTLFDSMRIVSLPLASGGRVALVNNELKRRSEAEREGHTPVTSVSAVASAAAYRALAAELFGVTLTEVEARVIFAASAPSPDAHSGGVAAN